MGWGGGGGWIHYKKPWQQWADSSQQTQPLWCPYAELYRVLYSTLELCHGGSGGRVEYTTKSPDKSELTVHTYSVLISATECRNVSPLELHHGGGDTGGIPPWNFDVEEVEVGWSTLYKTLTRASKVHNRQPPQCPHAARQCIPPWNTAMEEGAVGWNSTLELCHGRRGSRVEFHPGTLSWKKGK